MKDSPNFTIDKEFNIKSGILAGFIASALSSLILALLTTVIVIPEFNYVAIQGSLFGLAGTTLSAWAVYFIIGTFIWGILYAYLEQYLAGKTSIAKGLLFGVILWIVMMIVLMPLAGAGLFLQKYSYSASGLVLFTDLVFGATLGYFYNKLR